MERKDVLLAALAATKRPFFPVHLQKALFLVDRKLPHLFAERYSFAPYDYGPFDSDVYSDASELRVPLGLVEIGKAPGQSVRRYKPTVEGGEKGAQLLGAMEPGDAAMTRKIADLVTSMSFRDLVMSVYKSYPDMKVNSVFVDR